MVSLHGFTLTVSGVAKRVEAIGAFDARIGYQWVLTPAALSMVSRVLAGIVRVRIRGVYATALTKLLMDAGFQVVQASSVIASRFGIPQVPAAADVTVKSGDADPSELLVIGYPEAVDRVVEALSRVIEYSPLYRSRLDLYATVVARVRGRRGDECIAEVDGVEGVLRGVGECREGELVVAFVAKAPVRPGEPARLVPGVRVVGDYAMLYVEEGGGTRVTISEHIGGRDRRAMLMALATDVTREGVSVHWRSSARDADEQTLRSHLRELLERLSRVREEAERLRGEGRTGVVSRGESIALYRLSLEDKSRLDDIRAEVVPTAPWHHSFKSVCSNEFNRLVDFAEKLLGRRSDVRREVGEALLEQLCEEIPSRVTIHHYKLDGSLVRIGPAYVVEKRCESGIRLRLERSVTTPGVYDGLGVEKEPGDRIETIVEFGSWSIIHRYYSPNGDLKGVYANVNTPVEISDRGEITYIDLEVDVVKKPGEKPKVIDVEKLEEYRRSGVVTQVLYERALQEARRLESEL